MLAPVAGAVCHRDWSLQEHGKLPPNAHQQTRVVLPRDLHNYDDVLTVQASEMSYEGSDASTRRLLESSSVTVMRHVCDARIDGVTR